MAKLEQTISKLPKKPGVYLFKNQGGQIIYIGKALSLKDRIKSYFRPPAADPKTQLLVEQIAGLDYQIVPSEFEALILEAKLIKKYRPKYNLRLKDDKRYLYIGITKSPFRIFPFRRPELEKDLLDWCGPFPSSGSVRQVLRILRRVFPYCSCRKVSKHQCLFSHLNLCPGVKNLDSREYNQDVNRLRRILSGKTSLLLKSLEKKMHLAAKQLRFEEAQKYKQQLLAFQHVTHRWHPVSKDNLEISDALLKLKHLLVKHQGIDPTTLTKIEGYDVSNLGSGIIVGSLVAFIDGQAEKSLYRRFKINFESLTPDRRLTFYKQNDPSSIQQIIYRRLNHPEWLYPQLILVDGGKAQVKAALIALRQKDLADQICLLGLAKKQEIIVVPRVEKQTITDWSLLKYSRRSPVLKLLQTIRDESHRFAQKYYQYLHLKKTGLRS